MSGGLIDLSGGQRHGGVGIPRKRQSHVLFHQRRAGPHNPSAPVTKIEFVSLGPCWWINVHVVGRLVEPIWTRNFSTMATHVYKLSGDNCVRTEWRSDSCVETEWRSLCKRLVAADVYKLSGGDCVEALWKKAAWRRLCKRWVAENVYELGETTGVERTMMG